MAIGETAIEAVQKARHFSLSEWPDTDVLNGVSPEVIALLDDTRSACGIGLRPSRHPRAWIRDGDGSSRHYAGEAGDFFPVRNPVHVWLTMIQIGWGGIGIYSDTHWDGKPAIKLHGDIRPLRRGRPTLWARTQAHGMISEARTPGAFWSVIGEISEGAFP